MNAVVEALVFDLGDVLFSWAALTDTSIDPRQLKSILDSPTWHQYECNAISRATCFERCAQQFDTSVDELSRAFDQARASLTANDQLVNLIKELRAENQQLRVYAMSNISVGSGRFWSLMLVKLTLCCPRWTTTTSSETKKAILIGRFSTRSSHQLPRAPGSLICRSSTLYCTKLEEILLLWYVLRLTV
jgi:hypothetical protein